MQILTLIQNKVDELVEIKAVYKWRVVVHNHHSEKLENSHQILKRRKKQN